VFDYDSPEEAKQEITDVIHYCLHLLQKDKYITDHVSNSISSQSKKIGNEIENMILNMIQDFMIKKKEQRRGLERGSAAQLPSTLTTELRRTANKATSLQDT
jgi:hypothetical protein